MVPTSLCCPSRASLLTGKYAHNTGVWHNGDQTKATGIVGGTRAFMKGGNESQSLPVALNAAGYHTALVGKYFNNYHLQYGKPPGWDRWLPFDHVPDYYNYRLGEKRYGNAPRDYSTDVIRRKAVALIDGAPARDPMFLYVAPIAPHYPFRPATRHRGAPVDRMIHDDDFGALNERDTSDKPAWLRKLDPVSEGRMLRIARQQHRMMLAVDDLVGDVIDALVRRGTLHDTLLVFMSDNGMQWGEHRLTKKNLPYGASTEIPLAIRWGDKLAAGSTRPGLALNIDVTATIADAAELSMPWLEGESLLRPINRNGFLLESTVGAPVQGVRRPAYCGWRTSNRLFVHYRTGEEELYLLGRDPQERHSVAGKPRFRSIVRDLRSRTKQACSPTPPRFTWNE